MIFFVGLSSRLISPKILQKKSFIFLSRCPQAVFLFNRRKKDDTFLDGKQVTDRDRDRRTDRRKYIYCLD